MELDKLVKKLNEREQELIEAARDLELAGELPPELKEAFAVVQGGDESADAYNDLARYLLQYKGLFNHHLQDKIAEYVEYAQDFYEVMMGEDTPNSYDPL